MKKLLPIIVLSGSVAAVYGQQLKAGVVWPLVQFTGIQMEQPLALDTVLQDKRLFRMDYIQPLRKVQTDLPGIYAMWQSRHNFFARTELRLSAVKLNMGPRGVPENSDTNFISGTWLMLRPVITAEAGYLFGHKKSWNPFISAGISLSVFRFSQHHISTYGYNDYDAGNYYNHFSTNPWFLSLHFRAGFQRRAFTFSTSVKSSITAVDRHNTIGQFACWSFLEVGWHFYRSGFMARRQYRETNETNSVDHTLSIDLKKSGTSSGLRLMVYGFAMDRPYVDAWQQSVTNYVVSIDTKPEQRLNGEIFGNTVKALNEKKTWYLKNEYGVNLMTLVYRNAVKTTVPLGGSPDNESQNDLIMSWNDVQQRYFSLFYGIKNGYRVKTGRKSFVYADLGLRYQLNLKRYKNATDVPYIKKSLLWLHAETGFQAGHKGVQLGLMQTISKPDAYRIYKNIFAFYLGIYHEIYSK